MISKLPPWVEVGSFLLALIAGATNAIGLLGFAHQSVSHLTGTSTLLGLSFLKGDLQALAHLVLILLSFVVGSAITGVIVRDTWLSLGRRYGVCLLIESALLFLAMMILNRGSDAGHLIASSACGVQNAMATSFSGAIIRTTHVSGLFTDLGLMLGRYLRGVAPDLRRAQLYLILISGFVLGGTIGGQCFYSYHFYSLMLPASLALLLAVIYWSYWFYRNTREKQP